MPLYNTSSTATALGVPQKWLDNLLSHNKIDGVQQARQGVARRLSVDAIMAIEVARSLSGGADIPIPTALALAAKLIASPAGSVELSDSVTITLDAATLRASTIDRLAHAMEVLPVPTRGRPKGSDRRGA